VRDAERDAAIVRLIDDDGLTASEVGRRYGLTRERIRQVYTRVTGQPVRKLGALCRTCGERSHDPERHMQVVAGRALAASQQREAVRTIRLLDMIRRDPDGCWTWQGRMFPNGYGDTAWAPNRYAHRWSYEHFVGPIPEGLTLDHLCRNTRCVNPAHLDPVTHRENILRSPIAPAAVNARKTHCKHGHSLADARRSGPDGRHRHCRMCEVIYNRTYYRRRAARRAAA